MDFTNQPITEFYQSCLSAAKNKGYRWVVTLLAREADVEGLYHNLCKSWCSLDSITGKHFLFIFAGKKNDTYEERCNSKIKDEREHWVCKYNDFISFINPDTELTTHIQYDWRKDKDKNMQNIADNQTSAINALRDRFHINECDIPCLMFTSLFHHTMGKNTYIVPIGGNDIYGYFKRLFNIIDPKLKCITAVSMRLQKLSLQEHKLKNELPPFSLSPDGLIVVFQNVLLTIAETGVVDSTGRSLFDCVNSLSYGKFSTSLQRKLNIYVDLAKSYEKRAGRRFDPSFVNAIESEKAKERAPIEIELATIAQEKYELDDLCKQLISEIDDIIRDSKMEDKSKVERLSISVTGGIAQINTAFDNAKIEAAQYIGIDEKRLMELVTHVREKIPIDLSSDEIDAVNANLDVIECELKQKQPKKSFLKTALMGLQAIKGTVEFGAAIATLVQFVQKVLS